MDISLNIVNSYFDMLRPLSDKTKILLAKMLMDSILKKKEKAPSASRKLEDLYGIWSDDAEMDNLAEKIRENRRSGISRQIVSLDE
jgi:hypothetical protein